MACSFWIVLARSLCIHKRSEDAIIKQPNNAPRCLLLASMISSGWKLTAWPSMTLSWWYMSQWIFHHLDSRFSMKATFYEVRSNESSFMCVKSNKSDQQKVLISHKSTQTHCLLLYFHYTHVWHDCNSSRFLSNVQAKARNCTPNQPLHFFGALLMVRSGLAKWWNTSIILVLILKFQEFSRHQIFFA